MNNGGKKQFGEKKRKEKKEGESNKSGVKKRDKYPPFSYYKKKNTKNFY